MTASAAEFVTDTALQAVSGRPVRSNLWDKEAERAMSHIELARWADVILIAPATAEVMARIVSGGAPDLLTTICLATEAPLAIAPAMNHVMWNNPATQANRKTLEERGVHILGPDIGSQACGETGAGRMLEPGALAAAVSDLGVSHGEGLLAGRKIVITAGPTREPIDPVRYISNRSSGKMGFAIAQALEEQGAEVTLVAGPSSLPTPPGVIRIDVESALEMHAAVMKRTGHCDLFVATAAVADYRPERVADSKIKKTAESLDIRLIRNPDILADVAALENGPYTVGFAAETHDVAQYADEKRRKKGIKMIAANEVGGKRGGFNHNENALLVLWEGGQQELPMTGKLRLARQLVELIIRKIHA